MTFSNSLKNTPNLPSISTYFIYKSKIIDFANHLLPIRLPERAGMWFHDNGCRFLQSPVS